MSKERVILYSTREAKCNENHYIDFLVATQKSYSCLEAEKTLGQVDKAFAHDALNRLLQRLQPSPSRRYIQYVGYFSSAKDQVLKQRN